MTKKISPAEHPVTPVVLHWAHLISLGALAFTGAQIHAVPVAERASSSVGDAHIPMMLVFVATSLLRIVWAFLGDGSAARGSYELEDDWRHFAFHRGDMRDAMTWLARYLYLKHEAPEARKYNPLQLAMYVIGFPVIIVVMALTGLAIWPPFTETMAGFTQALGGEGTVRQLHYLAMYVLLFCTALHLYAALLDGAGRILGMLFRYIPARELAAREDQLGG